MSDGRGHSGKTFGNYQVTTEIGSGGFGKVYLGTHSILTDRIVAIKLLHAHLGEPEERERFLQEARLLERLKHPNILHIFDVGIDDNFPYIVAEYAPHGSLRALIKSYAPQPVPTDIALTILTQIGQALSYAHQQNIIHRDLKPENILFNAQREALLADFGIATTLSTASIKLVNVVGTPAYMAPEQFQSTVSKESDQYGLACIAYELFTGQLPFDATDFFSIGFQHMEKPPLPPIQLNSNLPSHIEHAILKAMEKQRHDRHVDIHAFIVALHTPIDTQASSPFSRLSTVTLAHSANVNPSDAFRTFQLDDEQNSNKSLPQHHSVAWDVNGSVASHQTQEPETPLSSLYPSSPSTTSAHDYSPYTRGPITPLLPGTVEIQSNRENVTLLPSMNSFPPAPPALQTTPFASWWPVPVPGIANPASSPAKLHKRRSHWLLFAVAALLVAASLLGVFFFAFPPQFPNTPGLSLNVPTSGITQGGNTPSGLSPVATGTTTHHTVFTRVSSTLKLTPGVTATATQVIGTTATQGTGATPTPTFTATAIATATSTPDPTPDPTVDPTPTPVITDQNMSAPFTSGPYAVTTTHSYSGNVNIQVSGVGQASQTQYSDAIYRYTDNYGNPITPGHPSCWVLYINDLPISNFVSVIPTYQSSHVYSFNINAPGGPLTFGVCDPDTSDNTGSYTITVTQQ